MEPIRLKPYPQLISTRFTERDGLPSGEIATIRIRDGCIYAGSPERFAIFDGKRWIPPQAGEKFPPLPVEVRTEELLAGANITSVARTRKGELWIVTSQGAFKSTSTGYEALDLPRNYKYGQPLPHLDLSIRGVFADQTGHVWLATTHGVCITDGDNWWHPLHRLDGMPYEDMLCIAVAPNGDVWGGTTEGAWRLRKGQWCYFWGKRWLPGNRVNAVDFDEQGNVWLATNGGVARIEERMMTLAQKAEHYEQITAARHNRRGWVTGCRLKVAGDPSGGFIHHASDNDGLWTAIYLGAEAFRYAVTKDPKARELAKKSMEAILDLERLSGYPGFPARAIIRKDEVVLGYDPEERVRVEGETDKIWYTSPKDPNLLCKGDTSSDELDGHYFAWRVYYDLVANEEEKQTIREVCRRVTDNLLQNGYTLVGHTGRKTRWGVFGPQYLNDDPRWFEERGLNSLSLLAYLKVAHHICGDQRYLDTYEKLIREHHYLLNTLGMRQNMPIWAINYSDDELAYLGYYNLITLEKDPHRRNLLMQSITEGWKGLSKEKRAFYNFAFQALTGLDGKAMEAIETLQEWPWELIHWETRNSHRHDITLVGAPGTTRRNMTDRVLPASERSIMRWASNAYQADGGGDGTDEEDGGAWLLAYWLGRYHGIITE